VMFRQALEHAGLPSDSSDVSGLDRMKCGILIGTAMAGMETFASAVEALVTAVSFARVLPWHPHWDSDGRQRDICLGSRGARRGGESCQGFVTAVEALFTAVSFARVLPPQSRRSSQR
jgi:hypothetical protein